jgi:hypothetical protein
MTARVRTVLQFGVATLGLLSLGGCAPPIYFAKATHGTIIDAETKQPIAGAVIIANWDLYDELWGGGSHGVQSMQITEVVTDTEGKYVVPGWGPRRRPLFTHLDDRDPALTAFKSGYVPRGWLNTRDRNSWVRVSDWTGRPLELTPFRGTPHERQSQLRSLLGETDHHTAPLKALYDEFMKDVDSADHAESLRVDARQLLLPNQ